MPEHNVVEINCNFGALAQLLRLESGARPRDLPVGCQHKSARQQPATPQNARFHRRLSLVQHSSAVLTFKFKGLTWACIVLWDHAFTLFTSFAVIHLFSRPE